MPYTVETFPNLPVVVSHILPGYDVATDLAPLHAEVRTYLDAATEPLFYIINVSQAQLDFNTIINATNRGARTEESAWRHPNIGGVIFVSPSEVVHRSVAGMNSAAFGNFQALAFDTLDEALDHVRSMSKAS